MLSSDIPPLLPAGEVKIPARAWRVSLGDQDFKSGHRANGWFWLEGQFLMMLVLLEIPKRRWPIRPMSDEESNKFLTGTSEVQGFRFHVRLGLADVGLYRRNRYGDAPPPDASRKYPLN